MITTKNLLVFLSLILWLSPTYAFKCKPRPAVEAWDNSLNIFLAQVTEVEIIREGNKEKNDAGERHGYFRVLEQFKGNAKSIPYLRSANNPICCIGHIKLNKGDQFYIFTSANDKPVHVNACAYAKYRKDHDQLLKLKNAQKI